MARFIFVTGGVVSSLGKGLSSASLAYLLKSQGYKVRLRKMDPYLNVDPGTMSPFQHGEVFVTDDGAETDLDLGHYERFTNISAKKSDNITTGKIYRDIIGKERKGEYLGKTVQVIPHVTDRIKEFIKKDIHKEDFVICEIGGTVGDIESLPFLEAIRELRSIGIQPDIVICRSQHSIPLDQRNKISLFCNIPIQRVIETVDVKTIYEAPISFFKEGLDREVLKYFKIKPKKKLNLNKWKKVTKTITSKNLKEVNIAIIGKYVELKDAYKSLDEALVHGGIDNNVRVNLIRIESDILKLSNIKKNLKNVCGILIPGGFGKRGTEGKIGCINYARKNKIPFFGLFFGMQMAIIEFARNELKIQKAGSTEFNKNCRPVIGLIEEWNKNGNIIKGSLKNLGGTMRLGLYPAKLQHNSLVKNIYKKNLIYERHRHRYEVNNSFRSLFEKKGMIFSGMSPNDKLPEIIELKNHPWFIGVQFHPEFKSRPLDPHPLFSSFIRAAKNK